MKDNYGIICKIGTPESTLFSDVAFSTENSLYNRGTNKENPGEYRLALLTRYFRIRFAGKPAEMRMGKLQVMSFSEFPLNTSGFYRV